MAQDLAYRGNETESLLRALALGDVAGDRNGSDEAVPALVQRSGRCLQPAFFSSVLALEQVQFSEQGLPRQGLGQSQILDGEPFGVPQCDRLPQLIDSGDRLVLMHPEQPAGSGVHANQPSFRVGDPYTVRDPLDDELEPGALAP